MNYPAFRLRQRLGDQDSSEDGDGKSLGNYYTLKEMLMDPKMLGEERDVIITMKSIQNRKMRVQMSHQNMLYNEREC
jgi:hypothetical protein